MGKPRSEGNKNREIHQTIPDHRVKLTPEGHRQAQEAGTRLRGLLRPDDTIHFFTSPYRRTRETTEGILSSLTADTPSPSPFPRHTIKVYEEPRLREQDFGNFQPCSAEMERMWLERSDYGHFFYRIPNGESAADAYDRVSGFNESMWRLFGEKDFASVCVLVTHGLMTRIFLMKWYHWSVEYFEDLRNINHCEFVIMKLNEDSGKYALQNQLRTWSELKREKELERQQEHAEKGLEPPIPTPTETPVPIRRKWGGCPDGCSHGIHRKSSLRSSRTQTADQRKDQDSYHKSAHDARHHHLQTSHEGNPSALENNSVNEGETLKAPEPADGDRLGDEMPLKMLSSNPQYPSTPEQTTPPHNTKPHYQHHQHHHHHRNHLSPSNPKSPLFGHRPELPNRDSEERLQANYNLIHLVGRDGGGTLSGAPSVAASEDERDSNSKSNSNNNNNNINNNNNDNNNKNGPSRGHLKRHKPRASQDLDNDGDDEGSERQTPKLRRTRSTHHRHIHPSNPNPNHSSATPKKMTIAAETVPDTDDTETDNASLEHQPKTDAKRGGIDKDNNDIKNQNENEDQDQDDDALERARKEDQSIRGSVY